MSELAGIGTLIRLIFRRDRIIIPLWISLLAIIPISAVTAMNELYPTVASREALVKLMNATPAFVAPFAHS